MNDSTRGGVFLNQVKEDEHGVSYKIAVKFDEPITSGYITLFIKQANLENALTSCDEEGVVKGKEGYVGTGYAQPPRAAGAAKPAFK